MKSRDIAIVGILLAIGAIIRYMSLLIPGPNRIEPRDCLL
jgi:hypothetical protein